MIGLMVRFWTVYHLIVFTFFSMFIYVGWLFIEDRLSSEHISHSQVTVWSSPLFYLVLLLNAVWLVATEIGFSLVRQETKLRHNIERLDKELKKPNCLLDERFIASRLSAET